MNVLFDHRVGRLIRRASIVSWSALHPGEPIPPAVPWILLRSNASLSRYESIDRKWLARMAETSGNPGYAVLWRDLQELDMEIRVPLSLMRTRSC